MTQPDKEVALGPAFETTGPEPYLSRMAETENNSATRHPIRSFVRREGRLTPGQKRAFESLWPRWGLDFQAEPVALCALFGNALSLIHISEPTRQLASSRMPSSA